MPEFQGILLQSYAPSFTLDFGRSDNANILIHYDEGNAHNEVHRHTLLVRMREVAQRLCNFFEFIYPTGAPRAQSGQVNPSVVGCQQGCPLIGASHALVMRMVHESCGHLAPVAGAQTLLPRIEPPIILDIAPTLADDGIAGDEREVLRAIRHMKRVMPMVGLRFSVLQAWRPLSELKTQSDPGKPR